MGQCQGDPQGLCKGDPEESESPLGATRGSVTWLSMHDHPGPDGALRLSLPLGRQEAMGTSSGTSLRQGQPMSHVLMAGLAVLRTGEAVKHGKLKNRKATKAGDRFLDRSLSTGHREAWARTHPLPACSSLDTETPSSFLCQHPGASAPALVSFFNLLCK